VSGKVVSAGHRFQLRVREDRHPRLHAYVQDRQFYWSRESMDILEAMLSVFSHTEMHLLALDLRRNPDLLLRLQPSSSADATSPSLQADTPAVSKDGRPHLGAVALPVSSGTAPPTSGQSDTAEPPRDNPKQASVNEVVGTKLQAPDSRVLEAWAKVFSS